MAVRVVLDRAAVRSVSRGFAVGHAKATADRIAAGARRQVRVKSGAVKAGIGVEAAHTATKARFYVVARHERSMLEHEGASPHTIVPRRRDGILHFYWERIGREVWLMRVNHPGTRGSKFLTSPLLLHGPRAGYRVTITAGGLSGTI